MNNTSSDNVFLLKLRVTEQEALYEKLADRDREIDRLQAQLDKHRRMNFDSRSEKVSQCIVQMESDLNWLKQESDILIVRADDPVVPTSPHS